MRRSATLDPSRQAGCGEEERPRGAVRGRRDVRLVPHTGFEPVISALRGRCPGPLDECGADSDEAPGAAHDTAGLADRARAGALSPVQSRCDSRNARTASATWPKL